jgi:cyclophilin family peptidyl-prolyl cis-trans isomerase
MRLSCLLKFASIAFVTSGSAANLPPEIITQGIVPVLKRGQPAHEMDLAPLFRDPDVAGSAVRMSIRIGATTKNVDFALFDETKPITVANFLAYVAEGRYQNNFIHRSVGGFVVQGGGFRWTATDGLEAVPTFAQIQNEPGISNLRGTVAMAKLGGNVNSATSQWFVNLGDNSANLDAQNGGFTVFARVVGNGMSVIDEVAALPVVNAGSPFDTLPVKDFSGNSVFRVHTVETNAARIDPLSFTATSDAPALVSVLVSGRTLRITPSADALGSTTVRVTATDLDGDTVTMNLPVTIDGGIKREVSTAASGKLIPAGATGFAPGSSFATINTPAVSDVGDLAARVTINSGESRVSAVYFESAAGVGRIVARQGETAPGVSGGVFKSFLDPVISPAGKIAFFAKLSGVGATGDSGVWTDAFGSLSPVLREGEDIAGLGGLELKSVTSAALVDDALVALVKLVQFPGGVSSANDTALVRITGPSSATLLARTGSSFGGSIVKKLTIFQPAKTSPGQGRWNDDSDVAAVLTLADKSNVFVRIDSAGALAPMLQTTQPIDGLSTKLASFGPPSLAGLHAVLLGKRAPQTGVSGANDTAILRAANSTTWSEVIVEQAESGGFFALGEPVGNADGDVIFSASRRGNTASQAPVKGLWSASNGGAPALLASLGSGATDADGVAIPNAFWSKFLSYALPDNGFALFTAQMSGSAVTSKTNVGLWSMTANGRIRKLLRTGDTIPLSVGPRTVTGFTVLNALPGSLGVRRTYTATGIVAVQVKLSDGAETMLRFWLP